MLDCDRTAEAQSVLGQTLIRPCDRSRGQWLEQEDTALVHDPEVSTSHGYIMTVERSDAQWHMGNASRGYCQLLLTQLVYI
jgi:hypothetical protein